MPARAEQDAGAVGREVGRIVAPGPRGLDELGMRQLSLTRSVRVHDPDSPVAVAVVRGVRNLRAVRRPDGAFRSNAARVEILLLRSVGIHQEDAVAARFQSRVRSEEHTSELQSPYDLVCRLLLEKKKKKKNIII